MTEDIETEGPNSKGMAFALWLSCLFGLCGIHRFYLGRPGTGLLYLFTFGLFGVGQLVDLLRLPGMVAEENTKVAALRALAEKRALGAMEHRRLLPPGPATPAITDDAQEQFRMKLLEAAAKRGGKLTVTHGVLATGKAFREVEEALDAMTTSGYVTVDNDPKTGVVVYVFDQLDESQS